ncbi:hypothetical protein MRB53_037709 [Persea americana]|nr:hypothetical protein MRB53_037709 [Persea americana]
MGDAAASLIEEDMDDENGLGLVGRVLKALALLLLLSLLACLLRCFVLVVLASWKLFLTGANDNVVVPVALWLLVKGLSYVENDLRIGWLAVFDSAVYQKIWRKSSDMLPRERKSCPRNRIDGHRHFVKVSFSQPQTLLPMLDMMAIIPHTTGLRLFILITGIHMLDCLPPS